MEIDAVENHDWYVLKPEDGEIYVFRSYNNAKSLAKWYQTEFNEWVEILAGMDGQSI